MNGGPGSSSMSGLFNENGPCFVNNDSSTTRLNPLSWNNKGMGLKAAGARFLGEEYSSVVDLLIRAC